MTRPAVSGHLGWIDRLRAVAAIYVVLHHATQNIQHGLKPDAWSSALSDVFGWGHIAVDVFIVLSGFCLTLPLALRDRFGSYTVYLARRSVRIVLPYYAACALSLLLISLWIGARSGTHWDMSVPVTGFGLLTHLLLIHQWWASTNAQIDHPLWSIGVEYQIYFLLPLLLWACRRWGALGSSAVVALLAFVAWRVTMRTGFPNPSAWGASIYYVGLFAFGVAAAWLSARAQGEGRTVSVWELWASAGVVSLMLAWIGYEEFVTHDVAIQLVSFFVGVTTAGLLYRRQRAAARRDGVATPAPVPRENLLQRGLRYLGERSFSLYLIHAPILQVVWMYAVRPLHLRSTGGVMAAMLALGLGASTLAALVFHRLVERPCQDWSRRIGRQPA